MFERGVSLRVGVDAVEPARLQERLTKNPRLEAELFTLAERTYCAQQPAPVLHLAARFCAKEAVVKALAIDGFDPLEIEVVTPAPAPAILLHGDVAVRAHSLGMRISISLTHLDSIAVAVAVAQRRSSIERIWSKLKRVRKA